MSLTDPLHVLDTRRSVPSKQLGEPGPDHATLLRMLASAVRVPDHGKLVPFRFIRLQGEARHALGDLLAARTLHLQPDAAYAVVEKDRARFSHAPVIVTVVARLKDYGLSAIEAYHSEHSEADVRTCLALAKRFDLGVSGGSDYHGSNKPTIRLGQGYGGLRVSQSVFDALKQRRLAAGLDI